MRIHGEFHDIQAAAAHRAPSGVLRVLMIEDSQADAELTLHALERGLSNRIEWRRVEDADGFSEALETQDWDVVLCDYVLPRFGVLAALALLRRRETYLPFIVVSGNIGEEVAVEAMRLGADDYVMKDNLARLVPAIKRELAANGLRKRRLDAERALRESEAKFRNLVEQAADGIFVTDDKGHFVLVNSRFCEMTGYRREELLQLHVDEIYPREGGESFCVDDRLMHSAGGRYFERMARRRDGSLFPVEVSIRRLDKGYGQCIVRDISLRRQAEQELLYERQLLQNLMANIPDVIFFKDRELRYVRVNQSLAEKLGLSSPSEAVGRKVSEILMSAGTVEAERREAELLRTGKTLSGIERFVMPNGHATWWLRTVAPIRDAQGETVGLVGIAREMTAEKEVELRLSRLNRVYAVLSGINALIVRVHDRAELYRESCAIATEAGKFLAACILERKPDSKCLNVLASSDESPQFIERLKRLLKDCPDFLQLGVERVFDHQQTLVLNDIEHQVPWAAETGGLGIGAKSSITLPLAVRNTVSGALVLYSDIVGFFDDEEVKLLQELAGDIAFAHDHLEKSERLDHLAFYDQLTGLANATLFRERLAQHLRVAATGENVALALIDVKGFKNINDVLGRHAGDQLLKQLAERMVACVADAADLARIGMDHFALILRQVKTAEDAARMLEHCRHACFAKPFRIAESDQRIGGRFGVALFPDDGSDVETLFRNAEAALKKAKDSGERFLFYTRQMTERAAERLALENRLRAALERDEFVLHYQPKVEFGTGHITGVEALIRWNDPENGLVPPGEFIPLLEETGLILDVGAWALRRAVRDHAYWRTAGLPAPRIAVNVSAIQLRQRDFVDVVREAISAGPMPPGIDLEITESLIMENIEGNIGKLHALRDMGLNVAIDDFGTGYSSLAYLARLPVRTVKIDRSFIITMLQDPNTMTLVSTIISLAHSLGLEVVAEGVDREEQARVLRLLRCGEMQGFLFGKSVSREELAELIAA